MSELIDVKHLIQHGAPADAEEARQIIRAALEKANGSAQDLEKRLSAALTEILVGRQLHEATYQARAEALAVLDEINEMQTHPETKSAPGGRPH
jgi:hypothetical protein